MLGNAFPSKGGGYGGLGAGGGSTLQGFWEHA